MRFALIALIALLAACAPNISANPGEIVYQVYEDEGDQALKQILPNATPSAGIKVYATIASCFILQSVESRSPVGYGRFELIPEDSRKLTNSSEKQYGYVFVSKRSDNTAELRMSWMVKDVGWPYARVILNTETTDPKLSTTDAENRWFSCLERRMNRVASAR